MLTPRRVFFRLLSVAFRTTRRIRSYHHLYYQSAPRDVAEPVLVQQFNYLRTRRRLQAKLLDYANLRIEPELEQAYDTRKRTIRFAISLRIHTVAGLAGIPV